jgi:hypothetical protein
MTMTLTPTQVDLLTAAANMRLSGVDLRFEGGPWVREADRLADEGLLEVSVHDRDYMVSYNLTAAGRAALEAAQS